MQTIRHFSMLMALRNKLFLHQVLILDAGSRHPLSLKIIDLLDRKIETN